MTTEVTKLKYSDKNVIITGGALGIGRCMAFEYAKLGANVVIVDRNEPESDKCVSLIEKSGGKCTAFVGDVAKKEDLEKFAEFYKHNFGSVSVLINNACLSKKGLLSGCSYEDFELVFKTGAAAPYYLTKLLLDNFSDNASIINISSTRAFMSQEDTESYSAAKGAISALTHAMAVSLQGKVRVNGIAPGWIDTGRYHNENYVPEYTAADTAQHLSKRVGVPEDIAAAVIFLSDENNSFINGQIMVVDGGMTKQMIYSGDCGWYMTV